MADVKTIVKGIQDGVAGKTDSPSMAVRTIARAIIESGVSGGGSSEDVEKLIDSKVSAAKTDLETKISAVLPATPADDGTYSLVCTVQDGVATLAWESIA